MNRKTKLKDYVRKLMEQEPIVTPGLSVTAELLCLERGFDRAGAGKVSCPSCWRWTSAATVSDQKEIAEVLFGPARVGSDWKQNGRALQAQIAGPGASKLASRPGLRIRAQVVAGGKGRRSPSSHFGRAQE